MKKRISDLEKIDNLVNSLIVAARDYGECLCTGTGISVASDVIVLKSDDVVKEFLNQRNALRKLRSDNRKLKNEKRDLAKELLLVTMQEISEDRWAAGWLLQLTDFCKKIAAFEAGDDGRKLAKLHEQAGGWWDWSDTEEKPVFIEDEKR